MRRAVAFLFLCCLLVAVSVAFILRRHEEPVSRPHPLLTAFGEMPAATPASGSSPKRVVRFGRCSSMQVNLDQRGRNILGDAANEPSICVDPTDPNRMAMGWRQFDNVSSNFHKCAFAYSTNGGERWIHCGPLQSGVASSDPVLISDADGRFHYLSLKQNLKVDIWSSDSSHESCDRDGDADGGDKQWMAIDTTHGPGRGNIYQYWSMSGNRYGKRQFSRSFDTGRTWTDPVTIPIEPNWGTLDVSRTGAIYLCGENSTGIWFTRSTNANTRGNSVSFDLVRKVNLGGYIPGTAYVNPQGLAGQVWIASDKTSDKPASGSVYMLSSIVVDKQNPCDVMFARSIDGGKSWSEPKRINDDPLSQGRYHWFGSMSVCPNGRIDVIWNDTRADETNARSALYYACSFDGGKSWTKNEQVSPCFNHFLGYPNEAKMGDYIGIVSTDSGPDVAYTATFNGEQDVYFLHIPHLQ